MNTSQIAEPFVGGRPAVVQKSSNRRFVFGWRGWWNSLSLFDQLLVIMAVAGSILIFVELPILDWLTTK